jgi:hypothetical protein
MDIFRHFVFTLHTEPDAGSGCGLVWKTNVTYVSVQQVLITGEGLLRGHRYTAYFGPMTSEPGLCIS